MTLDLSWDLTGPSLGLVWFSLTAFSRRLFHTAHLVARNFLFPACVDSLPISIPCSCANPGHQFSANPWVCTDSTQFFFTYCTKQDQGVVFLFGASTVPRLSQLFYIYLLQPELLPPCADTVAASTPNELSVELWAGARAFSDLCWKHLVCQSSGTGFPPCRSCAVTPLSELGLLCSSS